MTVQQAHELAFQHHQFRLLAEAEGIYWQILAAQNYNKHKLSEY